MCACVHACVCACVRIRTCVRACMGVCVGATRQMQLDFKVQTPKGHSQLLISIVVPTKRQNARPTRTGLECCFDLPARLQIVDQCHQQGP